MPTVPYTPFPSVTPTVNAPPDYITTQASPADFGGQVGQAVQGLGQSLDRASNVAGDLAVQQQLRTNNIAVDKAYNSFQDQTNAALAGDPNTPGDQGYFGLHGQAAVEARPGVVQSLEETRQSIKGGLENQAQQLEFEQQSRRLNMYSAQRIDGKYEQEFNNAALLDNQAGAAIRARSAAIDYNNDDHFQALLTDDGAKQDAKSALQGADPNTDAGKAVFAANRMDGAQKLYLSRAEAIGTADPAAELAFVQKNAAQFDAGTMQRLTGELKPRVFSSASRVAADNIVGGKSTVASGAIASEAVTQGQDPRRALTWASLESGIGSVPNQPGNPHTGLFQLGPDEWSANGGAPSERGQVPAEARVGVKSMSASMSAADDAVGGHAADWQGYLVHQQGQAGGPALLKADPNANVVDALAPAYKGDRNVATQAIAGNGGNPAGSVGDFLGAVQARYAKAESAVTVPDGAPQSTDIRDEASSMLAQARNTPDPFGGDDPAWHDMLESRVRSRIGEIEYGQAQTERASQQTLLTAAIGAPTGGAGGASTKPTDLSVLMQQPDFASAWLSAKPETQRGIMQVLEHNAVRVEPPLSQDAMSRYYELLGERGRDPNAFMKENLADPDLVKLLPSHLLLGLMTEQKSAELKSAAETEKQVNQLHALSVVKPDLLSAGIRIPSKPGEQAQVYDQFVGRFGEALDQWKSANKKQPTDSDVRGVGQSLLTQGYQTGGGWFGNDTSTRLFQSPDGGKGFYVQPPAADRSAIVRDWQTVHPGTSPSETQIRQVYTQSRLRIRSSSAEADPNAGLRGPAPAPAAGSPASP